MYLWTEKSDWYKEKFALNFFRLEKKNKMEITYFLVCEKPKYSSGMFSKIPISVFDSNGKYTLSIEERCKFSFVCQSCCLVTFLDFDNTVTREDFDCIREFLKNNQNIQD